MIIKSILKTLLICLLGIGYAQMAVAQPSKAQGPSIQSSNAKKIPLVISCGKPERGSIIKKRGIWTFVLNHGDIGKCSTDADARNSSGGVPYMERAEVSGHKRILPRGKRLLISAMLQADPRGSHVHNSIIFQVHQWDDKRCNCGAPLMLSFNRNGHLQARLLRETHRHNHFTIKGWDRSDFVGRWVEVAVDVTNEIGRSRIDLYLDGKRVLSEKGLIIDGGGLFFKSGIYREGSKNRKLPTEIFYMKDPRYSIVGKTK